MVKINCKVSFPQVNRQVNYRLEVIYINIRVFAFCVRQTSRFIWFSLISTQPSQGRQLRELLPPPTSQGISHLIKECPRQGSEAFRFWKVGTPLPDVFLSPLLLHHHSGHLPLEYSLRVQQPLSTCSSQCLSAS